MDKKFIVNTTMQKIPGAEPDHYQLDITGPEAKSLEVVYGKPNPDIVVTFGLPGQYTATVSLLDVKDVPLGGSSSQVFDVTAPDVDVLIVSGLTIEDIQLESRRRNRKK